jgi:hypothetical protein
MLLINVYHRGQILKTSHETDYDIQAVCTFSADETINLCDLKRQIHAGLQLLPSQFNISISARINTAPACSSGFFYSLFGVVSDEIWGMIKITTPYHLPRYKTLKLVVESELISSSDNYDPTSIPESSNPVMAEERIHSRAREQRPSRISVQNVDVDVDVDVDEDDEEEEWHLDVEEDDIQDATDINMDETDDAVDVEEIVREWQMFVPFINRGMKHPCAQFADNMPISGIGNCWCQKLQLTGIPCDHLLAVCSFRSLDYTQYVSPYYTIKYYMNTWFGH